MPQISTSDVLETLRTVEGSHINRDPQDHRLYLYLPDGQYSVLFRSKCWTTC